MSDLSLPSYKEGKLITPEQVTSMSNEELLKGYLVFNASFKFPDGIKYPSIPCYIDNTTTVYPIRGEALISGPEYLLARNQNCVFEIKSAFYIPPKETRVKVRGMPITITTQPFNSIIKNLLTKRREFPKGHIMNSLYKDLANSIYGNVVRGMSNKLNFDTQSNKMLRMSATQLSNPILASRTTAFIRSVIGECLHNIHKLGGKVVSVTTDGFITNVKNLEDELLKLPTKETPLLQRYRMLTKQLDNDEARALEVKSGGKGIVSWSTRGQIGIASKIKATAGFQGGGYSHLEIVNFYKEALSSSDKEFEYIQSSLRGAKDVFKFGGHVTEKLRDQIVRVVFDNRRKIVESDKVFNYDMSNRLFDSKPLLNKEECSKYRFLSKFGYKKSYLKSAPTLKNLSKYRSYIEVGVRNFIKGYLAKEPCFGLKGTEFLSYNDLIQFIHGFDHSKNVKLSRQSVSQLKHKKLVLRPVPKTPENVAFVDYLASKIPVFDKQSFLK